MLTKTDELFRREARARKDATASLEWLAPISGRQPRECASAPERMLVEDLAGAKSCLEFKLGQLSSVTPLAQR